MFRLARLALALLVVTGSSGCATGPATSPNRHPTPSSHMLPNGVRIVIEEHRRSEVVALQLWVQAGARDETTSELGLAHYLEHLLFKGTITRPPGFIDREVEGVGGRMNAGTSLDYTYYHILLPARRALAGIETLADISVNASLDETVLEREKRVVLEELRLTRGQPDPLSRAPALQRCLRRSCLWTPRHRHEGAHSRPHAPRSCCASTGGTMCPEAFTLVVVGAVDPAEVLATATRAFGHLTRSGTGDCPRRPGQ